MLILILKEIILKLTNTCRELAITIIQEKVFDIENESKKIDEYYLDRIKCGG